MAFRWRADDGPNIECWLGSFFIFQGVRTSIAKKTYIFVIFRWRAVDCPTLNAGLIAFFFIFSGDPDQSIPPVPPLDPPMVLVNSFFLKDCVHFFSTTIAYCVWMTVNVSDRTGMTLV